MEAINQQTTATTTDTIAMTTQVNKIRGSKARVLEQMVTLGYQDLNKKLIEAGFVKVNRNLTLLKKNNGDFETVLKILNEKMIKKALRLQKKKEIELTLTGEEGCVEKTEKKKRSRSEKSLRQKEQKVHIELKKDGLLSTCEQTFSPSGKMKKQKKVRRERCDKSERIEKRIKQKKERAPREEIVRKYEEWPTGVNRVFLDGNNMLFADKFLLKLRLKRQQQKAEEALSKLSSTFATRVENFSTVLVFDSIKIPTSKGSFLSSEGKLLEFEICSARPTYPSSDDALVEWMNSESKPEECLVVTSDRGLQVRLKEKGVSHLMKTGNWFKLVKSVLGEEYTNIASEYAMIEAGNEGVIKFENGVVKNN